MLLEMELLLGTKWSGKMCQHSDNWKCGVALLLDTKYTKPDVPPESNYSTMIREWYIQHRVIMITIRKPNSTPTTDTPHIILILTCMSVPMAYPLVN